MDSQPGPSYGRSQQDQQIGSSSPIAAKNYDPNDMAAMASGTGHFAFSMGQAASAMYADQTDTLHAQKQPSTSSNLGSTLADAMPHTSSTLMDSLQIPAKTAEGHSTDEASSSTPILATSSTDMSTPEAHWGEYSFGSRTAPGDYF